MIREAEEWKSNSIAEPWWISEESFEANPFVLAANCIETLENSMNNRRDTALLFDAFQRQSWFLRTHSFRMIYS
jgi:hypothetical protein